MTDEEMIDELISMWHFPTGIERDWGHGHRVSIISVDSRGDCLSICARRDTGFDLKYRYENLIGEHLKTLYEKCKAHNDAKKREREEEKKRGAERTIQLIKDL